jgi:hypothetical protein
MDFRTLNEKELKNNVILPLLSSIGFTTADLQFETTFQIQLGRGVYSVRGLEALRASGRLDVLCRRGGVPLCVIEVKAESAGGASLMNFGQSVSARLTCLSNLQIGATLEF